VRGRHELLFICTRGSFTPINTSQVIPSVLEAPLQEHSRKPEQIYNIIETLYPRCKYIELFARRAREGWESYGNELS
jgi:N6-adenosine-specific RNA methylase IME4